MWVNICNNWEETIMQVYVALGDSSFLGGGLPMLAATLLVEETSR